MRHIDFITGHDAATGKELWCTSTVARPRQREERGPAAVTALRDLRGFVIRAGLAWAMSAGLAVNATSRVRVRDQEPKVSPQRTVWDGVYTAEQASRGRMQYMQACASCHAADLRGDSTAPSLIEESFSFQWGDTTVGELFERIRTLMPSNRPRSLSDQSYRDIVAFILQSNKLPSGEKELESEADALRQIVMVMKRPEG
jgi:mono/diheme cytochrome c family protein